MMHCGLIFDNNINMYLQKKKYNVDKQKLNNEVQRIVKTKYRKLWLLETGYHYNSRFS